MINNEKYNFLNKFWSCGHVTDFDRNYKIRSQRKLRKQRSWGVLWTLLCLYIGLKFFAPVALFVPHLGKGLNSRYSLLCFTLYSTDQLRILGTGISDWSELVKETRYCFWDKFNLSPLFNIGSNNEFLTALNDSSDCFRLHLTWYQRGALIGVVNCRSTPEQILKHVK